MFQGIMDTQGLCHSRARKQAVGGIWIEESNLCKGENTISSEADMVSHNDPNLRSAVKQTSQLSTVTGDVTTQGSPVTFR
jgi:hypothetical protein